MRKLLAIETSSDSCSVALSMEGEILQRDLRAPLRHAELLLPGVRALLDEAGAGLSGLDAIVFGRGPGSFTSLRIGIGVVQGLAWGAGLPVIPISSLAAVAYQVVGDTSITCPRHILVAMDARMDEVFHCTYELGDEGLLILQVTESVSRAEAVIASQPALTAGVGNGFARYQALSRLGATLNRVDAELLPKAAALIPLAAHWLKTNQPMPAVAAQPVYIRNRVAEKPSKQTGVD